MKYQASSRLGTDRREFREFVDERGNGARDSVDGAAYRSGFGRRVVEAALT
jgi:hypothetical protein